MKKMNILEFVVTMKDLATLELREEVQELEALKKKYKLSKGQDKLVSDKVITNLWVMNHKMSEEILDLEDTLIDAKSESTYYEDKLDDAKRLSNEIWEVKDKLEDMVETLTNIESELDSL